MSRQIPSTPAAGRATTVAAPMLRGAAHLLAALIVLLGSLTRASAGDPPRRVVSLNLCTDQLALYLAAPGQLVSVSYLSHDETVSVLADEARRLPVNHGLAEEVFLLEPDLVLAGIITSRATVEILMRLGFRVERFGPEHSFADIRANMQRMGALLGRESEAHALLAAFDREIAALDADARRDAPLAAGYYAGGRTSGIGTLVDEILSAAGWRNLSTELGIQGTGLLPLELIVMNRPDMLIGGGMESTKPSLAFENYGHPALRAAVRSGTGVTVLSERYSICGTPAITSAVRQLVAERGKLTRRSGGRP